MFSKNRKGSNIESGINKTFEQIKLQGDSTKRFIYSYSNWLNNFIIPLYFILNSEHFRHRKKTEIGKIIQLIEILLKQRGVEYFIDYSSLVIEPELKNEVLGNLRKRYILYAIVCKRGGWGDMVMARFTTLGRSHV